jgi:uncharacterized membrane protein YidH (DUF202 family)
MRYVLKATLFSVGIFIIVATTITLFWAMLDLRTTLWVVDAFRYQTFPPIIVILGIGSLVSGVVLAYLLPPRKRTAA